MGTPTPALDPMNADTSSLLWWHPTRALPNSVMIVALGPTKSDLLDMTCCHEPPALAMECDEVWGINAGVNAFGGRVAYDLLWIMDHLDGEAKRLPRYMDLVARWLERTHAPLITSHAGYWGHDRPGVYEYPLSWVLDRVGVENAYFHNSLPYILAYAWCIGVQRIVLWGADYTHERSKRREEDRANAEYWVGFLRARGVEVYLPDSTTLCNMNRGPWFYGYPPGDQPDLRQLCPADRG